MSTNCYGARYPMNGAEKITDLPESAREAARQCIEGARISLKLHANYLSEYAAGVVGLGKTLGAIGIMVSDLEETMNELTKLHKG
jgi:hypothetical protein